VARLVIVTTPDLGDGYRLAGSTVVCAGSAEEAAARVERLIEDRDVAVIGVHEPYWRRFAPPLLRRIAARTLPVVIDIPGGADGEAGGRRARVMELLRHAIGHRIVFGGERGAS
jgi:vacuolar-type H+-ATPase subunit F/Vma7